MYYSLICLESSSTGTPTPTPTGMRGRQRYVRFVQAVRMGESVEIRRQERRDNRRRRMYISLHPLDTSPLGGATWGSAPRPPGGYIHSTAHAGAAAYHVSTYLCDICDICVRVLVWGVGYAMWGNVEGGMYTVDMYIPSWSPRTKGSIPYSLHISMHVCTVRLT